ncbi:hyaluronidase-like [Ruditapes philippinarum]|uniref:hyaluronidase-like n=1 Tax=Ruditapes philippinarum TaxID=129788 RepID=UPI00295A960D|nr:hyaluronidase-like [Ruditapes philippinarum]
MEGNNLLVHLFNIFSLAHSFTNFGNVGFADRAFVSVWNSPSAVCERKFGVELDLSYFDIVANQNDTFIGDEIVIFYGSRLGLYPKIGADGTFINGGLPQLANITAHLLKLEQDVEHYMPNVGFNGLAVIDWESWRPMFRRDYYNTGMRRYIRASEDLVRNKHPDWPKDKIREEAQKEFETAAREFIESTLVTCRKLRPHGYWGLYLFPNCYNRAEGQIHCSNATIQMNDKLGWMFHDSTSLFPSLYLSESRTHADRYDYVCGELKEALRVKKNYGSEYLPLIVPYSTYFYRGGQQKFYDLGDLNNTIQQVAEAGLNGIALWGSSSWFRNASDCTRLRDYLDSTLGPFIKNVTIKAWKCSKELCNSHGRCYKTDWNYKSKTSDTLLFESSSNGLFREMIENLMSTLSNAFRRMKKVVGYITLEGINQEALREKYPGFSCYCFQGWKGQFCKEKQFWS